MKVSRHLFALAIALWCVQPSPAWALATSVRISQFSELESQMRAIEVEAAKRGVPQSRGVTLRLQNYLEDVVILAGRTAVINPEAIADIVVQEHKQGHDKRTISSKLVDHYKSGKFSS